MTQYCKQCGMPLWFGKCANLVIAGIAMGIDISLVIFGVWASFRK